MDRREEPVNPYASPLADDGRFSSPAVEVAPVEEVVQSCPHCGAAGAKPAPYDWWHGRRGPRAIDHVVCQQCQCQFNGESGVPYPPAKSPLLLFVVALVLFGLYIAFNVIIVLGGF